MYKEKKPRDYRAMWAISLVILLVGIMLTISLAIIRPLGFALLGVGGIGVLVSLARMDKGNDRNRKDDTRFYN